MIKAVIVDDEEGSRSTLSWLLERHCPDVRIVGEADDVEEAAVLIEEEQPQLVFLDIELHSGTGFDVLERLTFRAFELVMITAYNEYAIKAFQYSALHYLLKPVDVEQLKQAVERARVLITKEGSSASDFKRIQTLVDYFRQPTDRLNRLTVPIANGFRLIQINDIVRLESDGSYTVFHFASKSKVVASRAMRNFEEMLDARFFRIHRTHLVNLEFVVAFVKGRNGYLEMTDGSKLAVSRYRKDALMEVLALNGGTS